MNISCDIIKDLLPLYHDEVCSDDSKTMIEEHLSHCENCRNELAAMDTFRLFLKRIKILLKRMRLNNFQRDGKRE